MVCLSEAYEEYWDNYANFSGRMSRKSFWLNVLIYYLVIFIFTVLINLLASDGDEGSAKFMTVILISYIIITLIPNISMQVRRLHDTNQSGACYFINFIPFIGPIILLIFLALPAVDYNNRYGGKKAVIEKVYEEKPEKMDNTENTKVIIIREESQNSNKNDKDNMGVFIVVWVVIGVILILILPFIFEAINT